MLNERFRRDILECLASKYTIEETAEELDCMEEKVIAAHDFLKQELKVSTDDELKRIAWLETAPIGR